MSQPLLSTAPSAVATNGVIATNGNGSGLLNTRTLGAWADADQATRSRLFEFTVEHANDPVVITTTELAVPGPQIVYVNRAFTQMSGYSPEEAIGRRAFCKARSPTETK